MKRVVIVTRLVRLISVLGLESLSRDGLSLLEYAGTYISISLVHLTSKLKACISCNLEAT